MTYLIKPALAGRARTGTPAVPKRRTGLGNFVDDLIGLVAADHPDHPELAAYSQDAQCLAAAHAQTAGFDAKTDDLARTWKPTGYYSPADMQNLVVNTLGVLRQATAMLDQASAPLGTPQAALDALQLLRSQTQDKFAQSAPYTQAVAQAQAAGVEVIDSPGLRRWILDAMSQASSAVDGAAYVACQRPWWASALAMFASALALLYGVAKAIVGVALVLVEAAAGAIIKVPDLLSDLFTYGKWAALAGGAWWLYTQVQKRRSR